MRQYAVAAVHLGAIARNKPDGANAMEERLTQLELIDVWRRRPGASRIHVAWIVHVVAEAGMCFQPPSVRQIHRPSRDVVNGGMAGIDVGKWIRLLRCQAFQRRTRTC